MKHASRILILALCATSSIFCNAENRTFEHVLIDGQESLPVVIDWTIQKMQEYPIVPGIMTAAVLSKIKESFVSKRSSFVVWAVLGAAVFAEPYRLFATEYLTQRALQKKDGTFISEFTKAKESAQAALESVKLAAQKGSQELKDKISGKIDEITGNDTK